MNSRACDEGYRWVDKGEIMEVGDEYDYVGKWQALQADSSCIGRTFNYGELRRRLSTVERSSRAAHIILGVGLGAFLLLVSRQRARSQVIIKSRINTKEKVCV